MKNPDRSRVSRLEQLPNVGRAVARDLRRIGIGQPAELIGRDAFLLYETLCDTTGSRQDPCMIDVFLAVIHFMESGEALPWWSFTKRRKQAVARRSGLGPWWPAR
ncbi:MAG TPA: mitomycin resistance protein [Sedimenticola thiotaurini]|uniref:Mitomycin resistance protein n=1 Tax=Sedimenticola thiotaurini TaxID=1543721 RepID=A0A831RNX4_9GAMM|nr:mitomycin resistance protein [Sedimenticola thiotaurini]